MSKTNFSGPVKTGNIRNTTGTTVGTNVKNESTLLSAASFYVDYSYFAVTTDANRLAVTGSNGASTTSVTFVDVTANVPDITAIGGFEMAAAITLTSSGDDSSRTASITGTDVYGSSQTEDLTMANAGVATSAKNYKTVTAISIDGSGTAGTLEVGILVSAAVSAICRSNFNVFPLAETSAGNLANNIVIPKNSRILDIRWLTITAFDTAGFDVQIGANVAQASGATLNSHDLNYFAGDTANDLKAIGNFVTPLDNDQTAAQAKNCLDVSDDDATAYEIDKAVCITATTDDALTAGAAILSITWLQQANQTFSS